MAFRKREQPRFLPRNLFGLQHFDVQSLMEGVFDKTDSRENLACGQHARRARFDELAKTVDAEIMNSPGTLELSKADERHLHQPAFISSVESLCAA